MWPIYIAIGIIILAIVLRLIKWKIKCKMMANEFERNERRREAIERKRELEAWRAQRELDRKE